MRSLPSYNRDYYGGALMVLIGLGAISAGVRYGIGTLGEMGAGFFPAAVGATLALIGLFIAATAAPSRDKEGAIVLPDLRGSVCIIGGILAFALLGAYGGLVPATFAVTFISALGDRKNSLWQAFWLASAMVVVSIIVLWWALQLQLPLFAWGR
jgi:hypothetical protein